MLLLITPAWLWLQLQLHRHDNSTAAAADNNSDDDDDSSRSHSLGLTQSFNNSLLFELFCTWIYVDNLLGFAIPKRPVQLSKAASVRSRVYSGLFQLEEPFLVKKKKSFA